MAEGADALAASYRSITEFVTGLGAAGFLRPTRCLGRTVQDLLFHLLLDAQRTLVVLAQPGTDRPDTDAVSYWRAFAEASSPGSQRHAVYVRRSARRTPRGWPPPTVDSGSAIRKCLSCSTGALAEADLPAARGPLADPDAAHHADGWPAGLPLPRLPHPRRRPHDELPDLWPGPAMTENLLVYALIVVVPTGALYALCRGAEWLTRASRHRSGPPTPPDLAGLAASLSRLDREAHLVREQRDLPGRGSRLRTVSLAYDDTLCACCAALGLPEPGRPPLAATVRLQTEALLAQHGVEW